MLSGLQDRQPFQGSALLAAEHVLGPAYILLPTAFAHISADLCPLWSGWGHGDNERGECGRSCSAVAQLSWLPQHGPMSHGQGVCGLFPRLHVCGGDGAAQGPLAPHPGIAFPLNS